MHEVELWTLDSDRHESKSTGIPPHDSVGGIGDVSVLIRSLWDFSDREHCDKFLAEKREFQHKSYVET
jgi:hypothetical protein